MDNRWSGFFGSTAVYLHFAGSINEARVSDVVARFDQWYDEVLTKDNMIAGVWGVIRPSDMLFESPNWYQFKGGSDNFNNPDTTDATGDAYTGVENQAARLMPEQVVIEQPEAVSALLFDLAVNSELGPVNYFLGGQINEVHSNATSVHPAMRKAIWAIHTYTDTAHDKVRQFVNNTITGISYNHHSVWEPDWRIACFGDHYDALKAIKDTYDPDHRFNVWHGVGYEGPEYGSDVPYELPMCPAVKAVADQPTPSPTSTPSAPTPTSSTSKLGESKATALCFLCIIISASMLC